LIEVTIWSKFANMCPKLKQKPLIHKMTRAVASLLHQNFL
jgi:hypothetical protein